MSSVKRKLEESAAPNPDGARRAVWLVTFANKQFYLSAIRLCKSAYKFDVDHFRVYTPGLLPASFRSENEEIFKDKRGAGYWIWKPFIILQIMAKAKPKDIIIYSDAGIEIIDNLEPLYDLAMSKKIVLFWNGPYLQRDRTKRDAFVLLDADNEQHYDALHPLGGFVVCENSREAREFMQDWLKMMQTENGLALFDDTNRFGLPELPEFHSHLHDQSVLGIAAIKHGIPLYRDPSQYGDEFPLPNSEYGQLINIHREKVRSWKRDLLFFYPVRFIAHVMRWFALLARR